jgi:hypothetical protein
MATSRHLPSCPADADQLRQESAGALAADRDPARLRERLEQARRGADDYRQQLERVSQELADARQEQAQTSQDLLHARRQVEWLWQRLASPLALLRHWAGFHDRHEFIRKLLKQKPMLLRHWAGFRDRHPRAVAFLKRWV